MDLVVSAADDETLFLRCEQTFFFVRLRLKVHAPLAVLAMSPKNGILTFYSYLCCEGGGARTLTPAFNAQKYSVISRRRRLGKS
jgi:hypothetical protein